VHVAVMIYVWPWRWDAKNS